MFYWMKHEWERSWGPFIVICHKSLSPCHAPGRRAVRSFGSTEHAPRYRRASSQQQEASSAASIFGHAVTSGGSCTFCQLTAYLMRANIVCMLFFSAGVQLKSSLPYQKHMLNYGTSLNTVLPWSALSSRISQLFLQCKRPRSSRTMCNTTLQKWLCAKHY